MRAQVVLTDMAISVIIALFLVFFSHSMFLRPDSSLEYDAYLVSKQLVGSKGIPEDWDLDSVSLLGLKEEKGSISREKVELLRGMSSKELRGYLNTKHDISLYIDEMPLTEPEEGSKTYRYSRFVELDGEVVNLGVVLSRP
jgi:hypothetical protein